ncbi:MAG: Re/Si-specific NAD(P)(+) transhydrogenase subunit alpha [Gammaproteobacteria bacterium]|nr:Re/Si-specific NAD(P)(+) transhydrogenase subunit alpha [Gammaproteobacteria bacterium]
MSIKIAVLKETVADERRVALDPSVVSRLKKMGAEILLETGAGDPAYFTNDSYGDAHLVENAAAALKEADILLRVQPPSEAEIAQLKSGSLLISHIYAHQNQALVKALQANNITCMAMELIPRITRAQAMDSLSSQATVAGYKAVLMAASLVPRFFPMLTTAAGTIRPSKVVVIGAGVAGLQAIATARRLGAQVEAYDIRPAAREQVESLGAKMIDTGVNAEGEGGYARELTDEEKQQQADVLAQHLAKADAVISTAAIPGRPAPKIISTAMVDGMKPGAVIVDLAAETGGNCELTEAGKTIHYKSKILHGPLNIASEAPFHASEMYAKNLLNLLTLMIEEGELKIDFDDDVIKGCLLTHEGKITHPPTATLIEGEA